MDDRGISELIGTALLIGLVIFASFVVVVLGSSPIQEANQQTESQSAETLLQEIDSRLTTLASSSDSPSVEIDLGDSSPGDLDSEAYGYLNLTVNGNGTCSFQEDLHQIRYEGQAGETLAYEAGGVFRGGQNSSLTLTNPDVSYRDGAVDITLLNISGNVDRSRNVARLNASATAIRTRDIEDTVLQGACMRPDEVNITVQSQYYDAWADYFESEFDHPKALVDRNPGNLTATVHLPQDALPRSVDDELNTVMNLSEGTTATTPNASYMDYVAINNSAPDPPPTGSPQWDLNVSKNAGNNYTVFVEPLAGSGLDIGRVREISNATNSTRKPMDVVLVMDESGSMSWDPDSDGTTKSEAAQAAARGFIADLNESKDRAGVVSYDSSYPANYRLTDTGRYLSGNFGSSAASNPGGVNGSIEDIPDSPGGGTRADFGLDLGNSILDLYSGADRDKIVILLTDGVNNGCDSVADDDDPYDCTNNEHAMDMINHSRSSGATVYTIGLGADSYLDEAFLERAANLTGGSYHQAENSSELDDVFEDIRSEIANENVIARTPMTSNTTNFGSGQIYTPQIAGDTDGIGNVTTGNDTWLNVNDPQAPSKFSHAFAVQDGDPLYFNVTEHQCNTWQATGRTKSHNGSTYKVTRCTNMSTNTTGYKPRLDDDNNGAFDEGTTSDPRNGILTDGDDASALIDATPGWWQTDINESLAEFPDVRINRTVGSTWGQVSMKSNQALVVFDLPDGPQSTNMLVLLYQIGLAESDARPGGVINVQVGNVTID